ncbi:hypothetical protein ACT8ZV_11960 [Nocardioides sp. MAHUQ-72]|uniref:hypothetical protein n=1 Tax=unclassified Nocardioides TaxID=2615069 RepID=UPI003620DDE2
MIDRPGIEFLARRHQRDRRPDEVGATAVEHALMTAFIAAVIVVAVAALGAVVLRMFDTGVALFP